MFICIEGNIGSGKSTLAKALAKKINGTYLHEGFEDSALLPLFYKDQETYAFSTEFSFLLERQKQLRNYFGKAKKNSITVCDYHFDKAICFAKANLEDDDYSFFKKQFKPLRKTIPIPDLVVYLDTPTDLLLNNIQKRGREIEKDIKPAYLNGLKKTLDKYYMVKGQINTLVLILTIQEYSTSTIENCCQEIIDTIKWNKD